MFIQIFQRKWILAFLLIQLGFFATEVSAEAPIQGYTFSGTFSARKPIEFTKEALCTMANLKPLVPTIIEPIQYINPQIGPWAFDGCAFKKSDTGNDGSGLMNIKIGVCADHTFPNAVVAANKQCPLSRGSPANYEGIPIGDVIDGSCPLCDGVQSGTGLNRVSTALNSDESIVYSSALPVTPRGGFGFGWTHRWQAQLQINVAQNVSYEIIAVRGDGRGERFTRSGSTWQSNLPASQAGQITEVAATSGVGKRWQYRLTNDEIYEFDSGGRLLSVKYRNGKASYLTYSDSSTPASVAPYGGLLTKIQYASGKILEFNYRADARISRVLSQGTDLASFEYNADLMLTSIQWPDGTHRQFHYEDSRFPWALTGVTDEKGVRFATYGYDSIGRATSSEHAGGVDKLLLSFLGNGQTSVTTADGTSRTFTSELQGNVLRPTGASAPCLACGDIAKAVTYDAAGNVASKRDFAEKETRYSYDTLGRETQRVEGYGTADAKTTTTEWHPTWNLPLKVAEPGHFEYFSYDANGLLIGYVRYETTDSTGSQGVNVTPAGPVTSTGWTYDSNGLKSATIEMVDGTVVGQWTYTYDAQGQLRTITDLAGRTARAIQYDAAGRLIEGISLDGEQLRYQYTARGDLATYDVNGRVLTYEYDLNGFLTAIRGGNGYYNGYVYDAAHRLTGVLETPLPTGVFDTSSPFRRLATSDQASSTSSETTTGRWRAAWSLIFQWLTSWISRAHAQVVLPVLRPIPVWPSMNQAPSRAPSAEDELMGMTENPNAILNTVGRTLRELATRVTEPMSCDEDPRCTKARRDAQAAHHDLTTKRWGQYTSGGTNGSDPKHRKSVIDKQIRLRDAIRRVKLYCVAWPLELPEWEYQANRDVPILY